MAGGKVTYIFVEKFTEVISPKDDSKRSYGEKAYRYAAYYQVYN